MTNAELISNGIAALGLLVAGGSAAIAGLALRRTNQAEKREREAIIVIRNVWSGTPGLDDSIIVPYRAKPAQLIQHNPAPAEAEQQLVIAMESRGNAGVLVRQSDEGVLLVLRAATTSDVAQKDGPGGHNTHYVLLEIRNVGRWAATGVQIDCTLKGTFLRDFDHGTNERSFPEQMMAFEALAANEARYVRIRNMTGLTVSLDFEGVSVGNDQPIRLVPTAAAVFQPRGYRS
jgi:hypothetical protein